jgi:hypothetical protein
VEEARDARIVLRTDAFQTVAGVLVINSEYFVQIKS